MYCDRNLNHLINFIKTHENWKEDLQKAPYHLKIKSASYNENWWMFTYNLFNSDFTQPICQLSRGTVLEIVGDKVTPVCIPLYKFLNYGDPLMDDIDWDSAKALEKIDGSIIKMINHKGQLFKFTNNSFDTNIASTFNVPMDSTERETDDLNTFEELINYAVDAQGVRHIIDNLPQDYTFFFELTSPKNRVCVKYETTNLWLLGARRHSDMKELTLDEAVGLLNWPKDLAPKQIAFNDETSLMETLKLWGMDKEGIVIVDKNFNRCKIKTDAYMRMKFAKGENGFSEKAMFECVMNDDTDDLLEAWPDAKSYVDKTKEFIQVKLEMVARFVSVCYFVYKNKKFDRREYAMWVNGPDSGADGVMKSIAFKVSEKSQDEVQADVKDFVLEMPYEKFKEIHY